MPHSGSKFLFKAGSPPNVVLIVSDQHRRDSAGCYGHRLVRTPNLDRLAGRGVTFTGAYCQSPLCAPSRGSLLTGTHVHTCEVWNGREINPLRDLPTIAGELRAAGYVTGAFGKMHIIGETRETRDLGFSERGLRYYTYGKKDYIAAVGRDKVDRYEPTTLRGEHPRHDAYNSAGLPVELDEADMFDALVAERSIRFLEEHRDDRFCLFVGLEKPHPDWYAPKEYHDRYDPVAVELPATAREARPDGLPAISWRKLRQAHRYDDASIRRSMAAYYANVTYMDDCAGRVLAALARLGLDENTVVIYTSDHGEMLYDHGLIQKHCFYEPAVAVPLIICGPGLPRGETRAHIVSLLDIFPTLAAVCGIEPPAGLEGEPLGNVIAGRAPQDGRLAFSEFYAFGYAERMVRTPRWKYVHSETFAPQLYDEISDPAETRNLAEEPALANVRRELAETVLAGWEKPNPQIIARPEFEKLRDES